MKKNATEEQRKYTCGNEIATDLFNKESVAVIRNQSPVLEKYGIAVGDALVVERASENDETRVSVWRNRRSSIIEDVGYAFDNFGDISVLTGGVIARYKKSKVIFVGFLVGVLKHFDDSTPPQPLNPSGEITVTCGKCPKNITGTTEFIRSEGWEIMRDEKICVECYLKNN